MPESPDFEQLATRLSEDIFEQCISRWPEEGVFEFPDKAAVMIAEQLRQVWNARGAADEDATDGLGERIIIGRTIRSLDLLPCECGCGKVVQGGLMEAAHPEDYRDERG